MDRPSERSTTLDPTTPEEPGSAQQEPDEPPEDRPPQDTETDEKPGVEVPSEDDTDEDGPGGDGPEPEAADDGEASTEVPDDDAPENESPDGSVTVPAAETGETAADDAAGPEPGDAAGLEPGDAAEAGPGDAAEAGPGDAAEAGPDEAAEARPDEAADGEPGDDGPGDDGPGSARPERGAQQAKRAEPGTDADGAPDGAGSPGAAPAVAGGSEGAKDGTTFTGPIDVQVIALALVEAATKDAARVSPAPTAPAPETGSEPAPDPTGKPGPRSAPEPAPEPEPARAPVPAWKPTLPPEPARTTGPQAEPSPFSFPRPAGDQPTHTGAPAHASRRADGSARAVVAGWVRDLRTWWTGVGPDGRRTADPAEVATRNRRVVVGTVSAVFVLALAYTITAATVAGVVPKGTTVAGTDVGGLRAAEAADVLDEALAEATTKKIELAAGTATTTLDPVSAGLSVDATATADALTGFSLSPARMWEHLFGAGPGDVVFGVNDEAFATAVGGLEDSMVVPPVEGGLEFAGVEPTPTAAQDGTRIDPDAAGRAITSAWLVTDGPVELPTETVAPEITQEEVDAALARAGKVVSGPVQVSVGDQRVTLPPKALASAVSFVAKDGALAARFDSTRLTQVIVDRTDNLLQVPDVTQFSFASGKPEIVGGNLGTTLDDEQTRRAIREAALGDDRTATLKIVQQTPENSTQALREMGVDQIVAEFSTPLTSDGVRTQNLVRGAEMISGDLIRPGETFSLVEALSPISLANGYVASGMIIGGQHIDGVGGGLSQMATTTYNAAMIAGFEDVEHHPHSYWFERYPAGHEATIAVGSKDMKVRNNTPYGAVLQSWVADNQLHVRIWSKKFFVNTWVVGEKRNVVPPGVVTSSDAGCVSYPGGQPGFTITINRTVKRIDTGAVAIERSYTTTYSPDHALACVAPPPPPPPPPDAGGGEDDTAPRPPGPDG
ncbi:hypothetical protein GCM10028784_25000 [Myceligenerans cantabricum]